MKSRSNGIVVGLDYEQVDGMDCREERKRSNMYPDKSKHEQMMYLNLVKGN